jgi:hypothetical protein
MRKPTRNNIARIHGILVLDKAEAVHEFNLFDNTSAMGGEVTLDISLGSCDTVSQSV